MIKKYFNLTELSLVIIAVVTLFLMIAPAFTGNVCGSCNDNTRCKTNLKNIGFANAVYFASGVNTLFPEEKLSLVTENDLNGDINYGFLCPSKDKNYIWMSGKTFTGTGIDILAAEAEPCRGNKYVYKVFQDAHVE